MSHSNSATKVKGLILELYRCILTRLKILDCFESWLRRFRELYLISPEAFADTRLYIIAGVVTVCLGKVAATTGAHWYIIFPTQCRPCVSVRYMMLSHHQQGMQPSAFRPPRPNLESAVKEKAGVPRRTGQAIGLLTRDNRRWRRLPAVLSLNLFAYASGTPVTPYIR